MSGSELSRRVRARGLAVLALTFVSGALVGAAIVHATRPKTAAPHVVSVPVAPPPERVVENFKMGMAGIPVVYEALNLTPAQRFQIAQIMQANRPRTDSLLRETWPKLRALLDSIQRQVEQVLTPEQRARLTAMRQGRAPQSDSSSLNGGKRP